MDEKIRLRGIGWDHPRCMAPLQASCRDFRALHPDIEIRWDARSLHSFGEGALEDMLDYDLVVFDHPYCGELSRTGWFVDFAAHLSAAQQAAFAADSLGPSWPSYQAGGGIWGLPLDAAAQVASYRPDLLAGLNAEVPGRLDEVLALAALARSQGRYLACPLVACDAICTFLTLCANAGFPVSRDRSFFPGRADVLAVLDAMRALADAIHPRSRDWNPIQCYEAMSDGDEICYVPYAFGYSDYARAHRDKPIHFTDIPGLNDASCRGALLGGAGIGVSSRSAAPDAAVAYARFLCSETYQSAEYFRNGGQPASLGAWHSVANDAQANGFFSGTRETLQQAYLRPTFDGFIDYFRAAGTRIRAFLFEGGAPGKLADRLRDDYFRSETVLTP